MSENRGDRTQRHAERGSLLLLWALTFSVTILLFVQGYFSFFQSTVSTTAQTFRREQALALTDAGLEVALWEIHHNNGASLLAAGATGGWTAALGSTACDDEIDGGVDGLLYGVAVTSCKRFPSTASAKPVIAGDWFGGTIGTYQVWVVNFNTASARIIAQGYAPTETNPLSTRTIAVDVEQIGTARYAVMGDDFLEIHGKTTIDSYNSTTGAVVAGKGHIGTNGSRGLLYDLTINTDGMADPTELHIDGIEYLATGNQHLYTGAFTDGPNAVVTQSPQVLPTTVTVPPGMFPSTIQDNGMVPGWTGFTTNGTGDFKCVGTCVCSMPVHINSLYVLGTVQMDAGCQIFVDKGTSTVPYSAGGPGGPPLDTDGTGRLLKNSTDTTKIFVKDGALNLDGGGAQWNTAAIAASELKPEKLQIYNTGNNAYTAMAQAAPFYGLVFVADNDGNTTEAGALELHPGNVLGVVSDAVYHGAFIAGGKLIVGDINSGTYRTTIRFDEALLDMLLDGSGVHAPALGARYKVVRRSWQPKDKKAATAGW